MQFRYGICRESLRRWEAFERISSLQAGRRVELLMSFIVDAELQAVEQATAECDQTALSALAKE